MKNNKILLGVVAVASLCEVNATAQISYQNGDMLAAFRSGSSPDIIVDLGSISLYQQFGSTPGYPAGFNVNAGLSAALQNAFGSNLSLVTWSVFGVNDTTLGSSPLANQTDPYTIWSTKARVNPSIQSSAPHGNANSAAQGLAATDIEAIGGNTNPGGASPGLIVNLAPGIVSVDQSVGTYSADMGGAFNGNFEGNYTYNIENTGPGVSDLYRVNPNGQGTYLGDFSLDSSGDLTFNPIPEPSTWVLLGTGMITLLAVGRSRKK